MAGLFGLRFRLHVNHRDLLHAANLQHATDSFTSPPKEGMLWIFLPEKSDGFGRVRTRDLGYMLLHTVTPYNDSLDKTRDYVTYQKLVIW
jgi:hypothetical protein